MVPGSPAISRREGRGSREQEQGQVRRSLRLSAGHHIGGRQRQEAESRAENGGMLALLPASACYTSTHAVLPLLTLIIPTSTGAAAC
jgi:hypothetical protein